MRGFGLLEIMIALVVLTVGLLSAGKLLFVAASSASLARSKGTAAIAAQDALESLAALYQQNPSAADLTLGRHGPRQTQVVNPVDESILNRYSITWNVSSVPDPRPGKRLDAKLVAITITPTLPGGAANAKPGMNKVLNVSTIFSVRTP
jgi:prepilin-type N-terminal cleavage/methylation domain-containing protein